MYKPKKTCTPKVCPNAFDKSEMKYQFQNPILKKPQVTRYKRFEQFLWHEFYEEYIRAEERLHTMPAVKQISEYIDEYGKLLPEDREIESKELEKDYPVYTSTAITFWNPKGNESMKKSYTITLPVQLQPEQFG